MRTSSIFKSRWMALIWAGGILWFAYDVAGGAEASTQANADPSTDVSGAPVTSDQAQQLNEVMNGL